MFRAILSLIIRSILTVVTVSGFIHVNKTRSRNYSLDVPDDERYRSKHVERPGNKRIINCPTQLHLVGHFIRIVIEDSYY
jgi:hypothetical protein